MKKILIMLSLVIISLMPNILNAEIKSDTLPEALKAENIDTNINYKEDDNQVTIYFFREQGESKSREFLEHMNSIYDRYGVFFKMRIYEVSNNKDNYELMMNTFDYLQGNLTGAPFIMIGQTYFITYNDSVNENIEKAFLEMYQSGSKKDVVKEVMTKYYRNYTLILSVVFTIITSIVVLIIYLTIKNIKENKKAKNS